MHDAVGQYSLVLERLFLAFKARQQEGRDAATVRKNPANVRKARRPALKHQTHHGACGVHRPLDRIDRNIGHDFRAAVGRRRMRINHHAAPVEFFENRKKRRIAEQLAAITGPQINAVRLQRIECVFDFTQTAVDVGKRNRGEGTKAARIITPEGGRIFVRLARDPACHRDVGGPGLHARVDQ